MEAALARLHQQGGVRLPGAPAMWSSTQRTLSVVLMVLIGLLGVGTVVAIPVFAAAGGGISPGSVAGVLGALVLLVPLAWWVLRGYRKQNDFRAVERLDVTVDARGLTLRGIGPIPWTDIGPAARQMVPAERDSGFAWRAVMPLTQSGLVAVNERLAHELRERISPPMGPVWNRHHRYLYVPGVQGLSQNEVMHLINTAQHLFLGARR